MPGLDNQPDLCIDKNGVLHCVFTHKLDNSWRKIYYTKSTNDGATWTTPEDISLNPDTSLMNPHIVADTNNILFVTYDYNTMNPAALQIKMKTFNGNQWSEPFVVSENMYSCEYNKLFIDNNNRLYVFWLHQTDLAFYRYFENGQWSDIICPYPGNHDWMLFSAVVDNNNNIHCVGYYSDPGPPVFPQSIVYFKYEYANNNWTDNTVISINASGGGSDIDIDLQNNPHIAYRQSTIGGGTPFNDSTMYTYFDGNNWSSPELVVNDPYEQQIAIDPFNRVHIVEREKLETGTKLVHYQKINNMWQGYIIDEAVNAVGMPDLIKTNGYLYLVYTFSAQANDGDVLFTKYDIITGMDREPLNELIKKIVIYPNPFNTYTTIEFETSKQQQTDISIYDLSGKHIKTIDEKKFSPGIYTYKWNGTDKNGKEVTSGTYLIRLQTGRHVITEPVEKVK
jgi:hypothetical protein